MKIRQFPSVSHDGGSIHSLDWHSSGDLLATCGQGGRSKRTVGLIRIWNAKQLDKKEDAILAELWVPNLVNCVRWSHSESVTICACTEDEGGVKIYEYLGRNNLRLLHSLEGHTMDVLHCEWSMDGRFLAAASVDSTVSIWNAEHLPMKSVVLKGHTEAVKGVSWDPAGAFLATQASDRRLKIWSTSDWKCVKTINDFSASEHIWVRLDWSPDGSYIAAPFATKNGNPTAKVISREGFSNSMDFIGHQKEISCVKGCPRLLRSVNRKGSQRISSCFALACRDKSLSLWSVPHKSSPLLVLRNFRSSISDLSWCGAQLAISTVDGSLVFLEFEAKELGELLTNDEMRKEFERIYKHIPLQYLRTEERLRGFHFRTEEVDLIADDSSKSTTDELAPSRTKDSTLLRSEAEAAPFSICPLSPISASRNRSKRRIVESDESNVEDEDAFVTKRTRCTEKFSSSDPSGGGPSLNCKKETSSKVTVPEKKSHFTVNISEAGPFCRTSSVVIDNENKLLDRTTVGRVTVVNTSNVPVWTNYIENTICRVDANGHYTAVLSYDQVISVFATPSGHLVNRFIADGVGAKSAIRRELLMILSSAGTVSVWNLASCEKSPIFEESILDILKADATVANIGLSVKGRPIVEFTNGKTYVFNEGMKVWVTLKDDFSVFHKFSFPILAQTQNEKAKGLTESCRTSSLNETVDSLCMVTTEAEIERALLCAQATDSSADYKQLATRYIRRLATNGKKAKIAEFFSFLQQRDMVCSLKTEILIASLKTLVEDSLLSEHTCTTV